MAMLQVCAYSGAGIRLEPPGLIWKSIGLREPKDVDSVFLLGGQTPERVHSICWWAVSLGERSYLLPLRPRPGIF